MAFAIPSQSKVPAVGIVSSRNDERVQKRQPAKALARIQDTDLQELKRENDKLQGTQRLKCSSFLVMTSFWLIGIIIY